MKAVVVINNNEIDRQFIKKILECTKQVMEIHAASKGKEALSLD